MWCYYRANISYATTSNLNSVPVEYLMKPIITWKMLFTNFKNTLSILVSMFIEYSGLNHITFLFLIFFLSELWRWITGVYVISSLNPLFVRTFLYMGIELLNITGLKKYLKFWNLLIMEFVVQCLGDGWNVYWYKQVHHLASYKVWKCLLLNQN